MISSPAWGLEISKEVDIVPGEQQLMHLVGQSRVVHH